MAMLHLRQPQTVRQLDQLFGDPAQQVATKASATGSTVESSSADGIDQDRLAGIRDNTFFRDEETEAWFYLLDRVGRETPTRQSTVGYAQLANQPDVYRGKWVRIVGTAKRVEKVTPAKNDYGIESLYRVIVSPEGSGVWPITVYLRKAPTSGAASVPLNETIELPISVDGYFFKNLSYRWEKGLGITPVVLGNQVANPAVANSVATPTPAQKAPMPDAASNKRLPADQFAKLLPLIGWDADRFAQWNALPVEKELSSESLSELVALAKRLEQAMGPVVERRQSSVLSTAKPGDAVWLEGDVIAVEQVTLGETAEQAWNVTMRLSGDAADKDLQTQVIALHAPQAWLSLQASGELAPGTPAMATAVVVRNNDERLLLVTPRLAWHPKQIGPETSFGEVVLGELGVDVGQLEVFVDGQPLLGREATAFYGLLKGCETIRPGQLDRFARQQWGSYLNEWQSRLQSAKNDRQRRLAVAVVKQAQQQRFSVAPLFNQAKSQQGNLVTLDGVVRRAVRVEADPATRRTFGIQGYYELELFTADSQDLPIVYCATDLPAGFPLGEQISQPTRVAGFFVKRWAYRSRKPSEANPAEDSRRLAPLLVGPAPIALALPEAPSAWQAILAGLAFVGCLIGVWLWTWRQWRSDAAFHRSTLSRMVAVDPDVGFKAERLEASATNSG